MLELATRDRDYLVNELGLSRRIAMRVGALLSKKTAFTVTVLEEAVESPELQKLVMSEKLRDAGKTITQVVGELQCELAGDIPELTCIRQDEWQVIAFVEELEAEEGYASLSGKSDSSGNENAIPSGSNSLAPAFNKTIQSIDASGDRRESSSASEGIFSDEKIAELRVNIFAGETSQERVSALRRLSFAPVDDDLKRSIFLQALATEDEALRTASSAGLQSMGLKGDVAESIRLLGEGKEQEKIYACRRLGAGVLQGGALEIRAGLMSLLSMLRIHRGEEVCREVIGTLAKVAIRDRDFNQMANEIMRLLLEQAVANFSDLNSVVRNALLSFADEEDATVVSFLLDEAEKTADINLKSFILSLATECPECDGEFGERLMKASAECVFEMEAEAENAHTLAGYLTGHDDAGVRLIIENMRTTDTAHQRFLIRFLDNAARFRSLSGDVRVELAEMSLDLMRSGSRQLIHDILATKLTTPESVSDELRTRLAKALVNASRQFSAPLVLENAENSLVRLGAHCADALISMIQERPQASESRLACRALGRMALDKDRIDDIGKEKLDKALRVLQGLTFSESGTTGEVYSALGRICAGGFFDIDVIGIVERNLFKRIKNTVEDSPIIEALGWLADSPQQAPESVSALTEMILGRLEESSVVETGMTSQIRNGEEVFILSGEIELNAELIPACLSALSHITLSPVYPAEKQAELVEKLLARWKDCVTYKCQWSPGNVSMLTGILGRTAADQSVAEDLRIKVVRVLALKLSDLPVMQALAQILEASGESAELDRLASAIMIRLIKRLEVEHDITLDDREEYLTILGRLISARKPLIKGDSTALQRRVVSEMLIGFGMRIGSLYNLLSGLAESALLPDDLKTEIKDRLSSYTAIKRKD